MHMRHVLQYLVPPGYDFDVLLMVECFRCLVLREHLLALRRCSAARLTKTHTLDETSHHSHTHTLTFALTTCTTLAKSTHSLTHSLTHSFIHSLSL